MVSETPPTRTHHMVPDWSSAQRGHRTPTLEVLKTSWCDEGRENPLLQLIQTVEVVKFNTNKHQNFRHTRRGGEHFHSLFHLFNLKIFKVTWNYLPNLGTTRVKSSLRCAKSTNPPWKGVLVISGTGIT